MDAKNLSEDPIAQRLAAAIELAQLTERSVFALTAKPSPDARFKALFAGNDATLVRNFNNPPQLRSAGFSLEHDGNSRIVAGELRRALVQGWNILELWRDGSLIYAVDAAVQPCWGNPLPDGSLRVNPLALAEPIYLFAELSRLVYEESTQRPERIEYRVHFERLTQNGQRASLARGRLTSYREGGHLAPASGMERPVVWGKDIDSGEVAYELVKEVYNWFGISDDGIPYTNKNAKGVTVIDPEALRDAGKR